MDEAIQKALAQDEEDPELRYAEESMRQINSLIEHDRRARFAAILVRVSAKLGIEIPWSEESYQQFKERL